MGGFDRLGFQVGDQGAECRFAFGHGRGELVERVACQRRKRAPAFAGSDLGVARIVDERADWSVPPRLFAPRSAIVSVPQPLWFHVMCRIQPFLVSIAFSCKAVLKATRAGVRLA